MIYTDIERGNLSTALENPIVLSKEAKRVIIERFQREIGEEQAVRPEMIGKKCFDILLENNSTVLARKVLNNKKLIPLAIAIGAVDQKINNVIQREINGVFEIIEEETEGIRKKYPMATQCISLLKFMFT